MQYIANTQAIFTSVQIGNWDNPSSCDDVHIHHRMKDNLLPESYQIGKLIVDFHSGLFEEIKRYGTKEEETYLVYQHN